MLKTWTRSEKLSLAAVLATLVAAVTAILFQPSPPREPSAQSVPFPVTAATRPQEPAAKHLPDTHGSATDTAPLPHTESGEKLVAVSTSTVQDFATPGASPSQAHPSLQRVTSESAARVGHHNAAGSEESLVAQSHGGSHPAATKQATQSKLVGTLTRIDLRSLVVTLKADDGLSYRVPVVTDTPVIYKNERYHLANLENGDRVQITFYGAVQTANRVRIVVIPAGN